ncbi:murein biosynthesis integral membrane protein MurJ [Pengzhenrongella frigida]|uniref:Murein biosynthesis integral membrane protein MurJ n=1 Tax=Pengzhenrongella frigida TaxID=1259133 RepID=A0A4V1ZH78_9MICO|nr:murein biosynthesis integral membrane protein MurJ [Cellulomonas sp. HLT2-17]RYV51094.1 murein biosynthesis integral membrane protein MurJ [Cellulomonas sp. HLT2-17]
MTTSPTASGHTNLGKHTSLMASGTAVSRILGFVKGSLLVYAIGMTGGAADAFALGNTLPNILYLLIAGGVLNAVLVPQVVRAYQRTDGQGDDYVNRLLTLGTVALAVLTAILTLAAPVFVAIYSNLGDPALTGLAVLFAYWCLPQVLFYGVYTLIGQVLNARGSFGPLMWAPVVNNLVSMAGLGVYLAVFGSFNANKDVIADPTTWSGGQVALLAGTATLGVVAQAFVLFIPLYRSGFRYLPRWGFRGVGLGRAGQVASWTFAGLVVGQLGILVVTNVASAVNSTPDAGLGVAGNAVYSYAFLVFMLPHSLVTVSLLTALFTGLSAKAAVGDVAAVRDELSFGLRTVGLFTVFATAVIAVLAYPFARVLQFSASPADISALATVIVVMILGLPAFGAWSMAQRVFYAYEDARSMLPIQIGMALVVVAGSLLGQALLSPKYWVAGAGAAMTLSYGVGAVVALWMQRRRLEGFGAGRVLRLYVRVGVAAGVAAGAGWAVVHLIGGLPDTGFGRAALICAVVGLLMTAIYAGLLKVMRVSELDDLLRPLLRRVGRSA